MTLPPPSLASLRELAERCAADPSIWYSAAGLQNRGVRSLKDAELISALTPAVLLALLADSERLEYLRARENEACGTVGGDPAYPTLDSFREAVDSLRRMSARTP